MQRILFVIIFLTACLSCSDKKNTEISGLIDLNKIDPVSINDLFESIEVVQLETNAECLIAHATKIIFYDNRYYVFDVRQQAIFCFDSTGKFVFKIANRGQGPEEYLNLEDFNIDSYNQQVLLLVPFGSLVTFDTDGKCILDYGEPEFRHVFYDKETNQPFVFDKTIENIQFLIPNFNEEAIIVSEQAFKYKIYEETLLSEDQKTIIHSHKAEDNPFLIKYNLKQMQ
jgi:hypothetical protein